MDDNKKSIEFNTRDSKVSISNGSSEGGTIDQITDAVEKHSVEKTFHEFEADGVRGKITGGTNFDEVYAGLSVENFFKGNNGEEQVKAGLILDNGELKSYVGTEISHDKDIEIEGISARFEAAAAYIPDESPYAYAAASLRYDRPEGVESRLHSADVKLLGGVHGGMTFAGVEGGLRLDVTRFGEDGDKLLYVFNRAAYVDDGHDPSVHLKGGVGAEIPLAVGPKLSVEAGLNHNTNEPSLSEQISEDRGDEGTGVFLGASISF